MKKKYLEVRWGAAAAYLFTLSLIHLGRLHIGLLFDFIYFALLIIPVITLAHLFISLASVKYHQTFGTDHPIKGEVLTYSLLLANESLFPTVPMRIRFRTVQPGQKTQLPDLHITLKRGQRRENSFQISCPFRGVYTVGLEQLEMRDLLGWITIHKAVWHRTFYVLPRIISVEFPFSIGTTRDLHTGPNPGASQDYSLFEALVPYRQGQSIRHMAWKKFIALGEPFLKTYGKTSQPGVSLYLDLRRNEEPSLAVLEREDCSIEIVVALVKFCLDRSIPVSVNAMGQSRYHFTASDPSEFQRFHQDTVNVLFHDTISPAELYRGDMQGSVLPASVVFITHLLDQEILTILEESINSQIDNMIAAIFNLSGMDRRKAGVEYLSSMVEKGSSIALVEESSTISESLKVKV